MTGLLVLTGPLSAAQGDGVSPVDKARKLAQSGKLDEAFLTYLTIPGCEYLAAQIARPKAERYLQIVREHAAEIPPMTVPLIEGDLLLALGNRNEALVRFRTVAASLHDAANKPPRAKILITEGYFVEPPAVGPPGSNPGYAAAPFAAGPGSHRDNWLIRRFIALGAVNEAAGEFARVWEIHRSNARPYLLDVVVRWTDKPVHERKVVQPYGFDGRGLQFALHYSFFLKQHGKLD